MKKIFTLLFTLAATLNASAQLQFADKDGNAIADGSTITVTTVEDDGLGGKKIDSGLWVKNTGATTVYTNAVFNVQTTPPGGFQICYPKNCIEPTYVAGEGETMIGELEADYFTSIQSELLLNDDAQYCETAVDIQLKIYNYNAISGEYEFKENGPKVTVVFVYTESAGINSLNNVSQKTSSLYNLAGQRVSEDFKGITVKNGKKYLTK